VKFLINVYNSLSQPVQIDAKVEMIDS